MKTVLSRIFGPKREEVAGSWRTLHNEELHQILFDHIEDEMGRACSAYWRYEKYIQNFWRKA
jgi:hypothetical protein